MSELLPCPFCGSENIEKKINQYFPGVFTVIIGCADCPSNPIEVGKSKDEAEQKAVERWNTRHYPPEVQQAIERMKPKKVIRHRYIENYNGFTAERCKYNCAVCNGELEDMVDFCPHENCGQALDWSE